MKHNISILIIIFSLIALSGCNQEDISNYAKEAIDNPELCKTIDYSGSVFNSDNCYAYVAMERQDLDLCDNIDNSIAVGECKFEIRDNLGYGSLADCKEIPETKPEKPCYIAIAESLTDISECEEFPEEYRYLCHFVFASRTQDTSICDDFYPSLTPPFIEEELTRITSEAQNEGKPINEDFEPIIYLEDRHTECYDYVAFDNKNTEFCRTPHCIERIAKATDDYSVCLELKEMNVNEDHYDLKKIMTSCLLSTTSKSTDAESCNFLDEEDRASCIRNIAVNVDDITLCSEIQIYEEVPSCEQGEGCAQTVSYLDKTEEYKINNCYLPIAQSAPEKCNDVARTDSMKLVNACFYSLSRALNDPSLCSNIIIPEIDDMTCEKYLDSIGFVATVPQ